MNQQLKNLPVTLLQADLFWEQPEKNLQLFEQMIDELKEVRGLVFLPEMFNTGFSVNPESMSEHMDGLTVQWMKGLSRKKGIILSGSLMIAEDGHYYNRLLWVLPTGDIGYYDKRHLFAYGGEDNKFSPGGKRLIAAAGGWKINLQICYDLRFPVWARQSRPINILPDSSDPAEPVPEYDLLVFVANWPEKRIDAWKTLLKARAIENQCYVIGLNRCGTDFNGINYSGDSMIVDPLGEIMMKADDQPLAMQAILSGDHLQQVRDKYPFLQDGDEFIIGHSLL